MIDKLIDSISLTDGNISVEFVLDRESYEVEQFKIGFSQPVDYKGKPQSETLGGQMMIILQQTIPESFYAWNIKNTHKDGFVVFKTKRSGTVLRIAFFDAKCISLHRTIAIGRGVESTIIISPSRVLINEIEHDNFWIKN